MTNSYLKFRFTTFAPQQMVATSQPQQMRQQMQASEAQQRFEMQQQQKQQQSFANQQQNVQHNTQQVGVFSKRVKL